jgi:hypothetical protein
MHALEQKFDLDALADDVKRVNCITVTLFLSNLRRLIAELDRFSPGNDFDRVVTRVHCDGFALARCIVTRGADALLDDDPYVPPLREIMLTSLERLRFALARSAALATEES